MTPAHDLNDDLLREILLRLPAKSVLRFAAVCESWRRITTDPSFLAAHRARRRLLGAPELIVRTLTQRVRSDNPDPEYYGPDVSLCAIDPGDVAIESRRLIAIPGGPWWEPPRELLGSCDGLMLFRQSELYLFWNTMTGQWTDLPRLSPELPWWLHRFAGFYFHRTSGEHRALLECCTWTGRTAYYVLETGAAPKARRLDALVQLSPAVGKYPPHVAVNGRLHWLYRPESYYTVALVVFSTARETFGTRALPLPLVREGDRVTVFEMDGKLALLRVLPGPPEHVAIWVLEDYSRGWWTFRHRLVVAPSDLLAHASACDARRLQDHPGITVGFWAVALGGGDVSMCSESGFDVYNVEEEKKTRTFRVGGQRLEGLTNVTNHTYRPLQESANLASS